MLYRVLFTAVIAAIFTDGYIGITEATLINKGFLRLEDFLPDFWQYLLTLKILIFIY